jgi:hypothetical protein
LLIEKAGDIGGFPPVVAGVFSAAASNLNSAATGAAVVAAVPTAGFAEAPKSNPPVVGAAGAAVAGAGAAVGAAVAPNLNSPAAGVAAFDAVSAAVAAVALKSNTLEAGGAKAPLPNPAGAGGAGFASDAGFMAKLKGVVAIFVLLIDKQLKSMIYEYRLRLSNIMYVQKR